MIDMAIFFKGFLAIALFFITLAFGGTQPWSFLLFFTAVSALLLLLSARRGLIFNKPLKIAAAGFIFLILYSLLQACFPSNILMPAPKWPSSIIPLFTLGHISIFLMWFAVFILSANLVKEFKDVKIILAFILIPAAVTGLLHLCLEGYYISLFTHIKLGVGPFLNRNHGGIFLFLGSFVSLSLTLSFYQEKAKYAAEGKLSDFYPKIAAMLILTGFLILSAVFTRSRGALLALFSAAFAYAGLLAAFIPKNLKNKLILLSAAITLFGGIAFTAFSYQKEINTFAKRSNSISVNIRKDFYSAALKALKERPLFGYGIGTLPIMIPNYMDNTLDQYVERLHSDPLELLLGAGFAGAIPLAGAVITFFVLLTLRIKNLPADKKYLCCGLLSALLGFIAASFVDFHFYIPACAAAFFIIAGLLCSPTFYRNAYSRRSIGTIPLLILGVILSAALYLPFKQTQAWRLSNFAGGLLFERKVQTYELAFKAYPAPRNALKLAVAYYNESLSKDISAEEKALLKEKAHTLAETYLKKYPREKELSKLYMITL